MNSIVYWIFTYKRRSNIPSTFPKHENTPDYASDLFIFFHSECRISVGGEQNYSCSCMYAP